MSLLTRENWASLIPHGGAMALIDAVASWDEKAIHAIAMRHARESHPLRSAAGLHAVHLAEYGAQAAAVHGALLAERAARAGRLVSLRDLRLGIEYVDLSRGSLQIQAQRLHADEQAVQYTFTVSQLGEELASGRVLVMYASV